MLVVQMSITENVHGIFQAVIIVEKFEAARNSKDNFCSLAHVQGMNGSGILNHIVTGSSDPVVPDSKILARLSFFMK